MADHYMTNRQLLAGWSCRIDGAAVATDRNLTEEWLRNYRRPLCGAAFRFAMFPPSSSWRCHGISGKLPQVILHTHFNSNSVSVNCDVSVRATTRISVVRAAHGHRIPWDERACARSRRLHDRRRQLHARHRVWRARRSLDLEKAVLPSVMSLEGPECPTRSDRARIASMTLHALPFGPRRRTKRSAWARCGRRLDIQAPDAIADPVPGLVLRHGQPRAFHKHDAVQRSSSGRAPDDERLFLNVRQRADVCNGHAPRLGAAIGAGKGRQGMGVSSMPRS